MRVFIGNKKTHLEPIAAEYHVFGAFFVIWVQCTIIYGPVLAIESMGHSVEGVEGGTSGVRTTRTIIPARFHIDGDEILYGMAADRVYIWARVVLGRIPAGFV